MHSNPPLRLLIVDDHAVVREGLEAMLEDHPGIQKIATGASTDEALRLCESFRPHVILLDLRMPGSDGFNALEMIRGRWPAIKVLILSSSATSAEVKLAKREGAVGYLSKSFDYATIVKSIMIAAAGGMCFPEAAVSRAEGPALSARELEVLRNLGRGLSNQELATVLGISPGTVKTHIKSIFHKLDAVDRAEVIARAYKLGLLDIEG